MSPATGATATKEKVPGRRKRGEGQWALGYREPLNKNEENKRFDDGLNVRRPSIDGGKTAVLEPEELDDRYFMLRVRIDGGQLTSRQLRTIADISNTYARGTA